MSEPLSEPLVKETSPEPKPPKEAGLTQRRIEMPIGLWNEVLELGKAGGIDHRDTVLMLIDLGLQAQEEGNFKPRILSIEHSVWERVEAAQINGVDARSALVHLIDLGLQSRAAQLSLKAPLRQPDGTTLVRFDLILPGGKLRRLAERFMRTVPSASDVVTVQGQSYEVQQRAWTIGSADETSYLRVKRYGLEE